MTREMDEKAYTVKQVAAMAGVTIKTLHHYDALGLLRPARVSTAGYRLYGRTELERLQQIMFYRELDVPLREIQLLLDGETDRAQVLHEQSILLRARRERLDRLIRTIDTSIHFAQRGEHMHAQNMFHGFATEEEWKQALEKHNKHVKDTYGTDLAKEPIDVPALNASAAEAKKFMDGMAEALRNKVPHNDPVVKELIKNHLAFLKEHGPETSPNGLAKQTAFFLDDTFHRDMPESQQTGLAYYLAAAATAYAAA